MWENLSRGFILFVIGVAKKVALADTLAMLADPLFAKALTGRCRCAEAWTAGGAYTLQIYFDFSGYSDMAIGLALMFGLRLPFNFDAPYRAVSMRRLLAALAHDAVAASCATICTSRWAATAAARAPGGERGGHHAAGRAVARRQLDVRRLGRAARRGAGGEPFWADAGFACRAARLGC